ncbi:Glycoprotein 3-alpha-L-fucosyltransferase A [Exaiptasia diaphana]|nr:Glycoprotein 3-alpha-L-fucosyltransferase A [Exaiptasia diaphana]
MVAWISSNCRDSFGRFSLVKNLSKYIQVDIFGKCGLNRCPMGIHKLQSPDCSLKLRKYRFYLAFENSRCVDYITEKYWQNALDNELVPVVMGGADYENIAVPGSYINVNDFESVKQLADYLMHLAANADDYNNYFKWKTRFKLDTPYLHGCSICAALNSNKDF